MGTTTAEPDTLEEGIDEVVDEPKKRTKKQPLGALTPNLLKPPKTLHGMEPVGSHETHLRMVSFGKPVTNVSALLVFDLDIPTFDADLMGEHAYAVTFQGGFLGDGAIIKEAPLKADDANAVHQQLKIRIPRYLNQEYDQILMCVAPLIGGRELVEELFRMEWSWRLNIQTDIPGELLLYSAQQTFDLTSTAGDDSLTREPVH